MKPARILVIAGSDSGGGAGIQADIKTVTMLGGHAMTAITALTAQNTLGVQAVMPVPADMVLAQIDACVSDIGVDAVKIGMIGSAEVADAVAARLERIDAPVVFDPVMVATSGSVLADTATVAAFDRLMRRATLVTPNLPELAALGGEAAVRATGAALLAKGGHGEGEQVIDRLVEANGNEHRWAGERIDTSSTHGTGCTLASAIAEGLGRGLTLSQAVARARLFVRIALHEAPGLGAGHGPMGQGRVRLDLDLGGPATNQVTLPAADHDASVAFYRLLGLRQIVASGGRYARFEGENGATLSVEAADEVDGRAVVFLEVDDLDGAVARLRTAGHRVDDPVAQPWGWQEARLRDPAGNPLCLYRAGENRRFPPWRLS
ncbi:hydroxymethylpyrimidine/phosphomethylpyrimidine kinase [Sphingomonas gellani]|uniref:hydroxymethylpyrimidine kinase n=1 Tax=Sphingomonas gellani TaxID=1166340 RepID=A0A1H8DMS1_9SPHN|nr:bifunctional hydroxymethylpyrimidine kinase/phosphomethylpyrimidine kinase [Sphingomonas gellani]SEN07828.1 hydroxymethylpyrimidine/phosphomethylpyrimidine kinase [Sphingomonas gellani]